MSTIANIGAVARREYTVRIRTRTFGFGTLLLVIGVMAIALLPVIIQAIDRSDAAKVAVQVEATDLATDPVATLDVLLNAQPQTDAATTPKQPDFIVSKVPDLAAARQAVMDGSYAAVLSIARGPDDELDFTLYTNDNATGKTAGLVHQGSNVIAYQDRLARLGIEAKAVQAPARFDVAWPDPKRSDPTRDTATMVGQDMLAFGMTILIYMIILMYGTWIAMSVVEEKTSRVMEVILNAATPFQLLTGKVLGVGAVAFTQYAAVVIAGGATLLFQGPIAQFVLGEGGSADLPEGLTLGLLFVFGVYGVLGFLMYAALYAAAGSLVSRQEDVNAAVMPMTLVSTGGYLIGVYAAMGLLDIHSGWVTVLSQVPLVSPFMMLGRITTEVATPLEVVLSIGLLAAAIGGALWLAARIYAAGVLLYGQRPGIRSIWRLVRTGM